MHFLGYISVLLISGPFMFGMPNITTSILSPSPGPSADLGVILGGTMAPYIAYRFGSGNIPSSTPFVEDFYSLLPVSTQMFTLMGVVVNM